MERSAAARAEAVAERGVTIEKAGDSGGHVRVRMSYDVRTSPVPFGKVSTFVPFWWGRSSQPCMAMVFTRTGTYAGCVWRIENVKTCIPPSPRR